MSEWKIKNRETLLQNIAAGLNHRKTSCLVHLEAVFYEDGEVVMKRDVPTALDYLANDIYWDEDSDWSNADTASVETL